MPVFSTARPGWVAPYAYGAYGAPIAVDSLAADFYGANAGTYNPNPLNPGYPTGSFGRGAVWPVGAFLPSGAIDSPCTKAWTGGAVIGLAAGALGMHLWMKRGKKK